MHFYKTRGMTWVNSIAATLVFMFFLIYANSSHAVTVENYRALRAETQKTDVRRVLNFYILGLKDGLEWSNATLSSGGKGQVYCVPQNLALNAENYIQFIDEALNARREKPLAADFPLTPVLLDWLQKKFPC